MNRGREKHQGNFTAMVHRLLATTLLVLLCGTGIQRLK